MKKKISLLIVIIMLMSSANVSAQELDRDKFSTDVDFMKNVIYFVLDKYQYEVGQEAVMKGLYDGFFSVLDEYSVYYTPEEYQSLLENTAGQYVGIGVQIIDENGHVKVVTPLHGSPAMEAGIIPGDIIKYVDDKDITGFTAGAASDLIKGKEGTTVKIGIIRNGKNITLELVRKEIVTSTVEGNIMDNNIGYLKITEFADNTAKLVKNELAVFDDNNVKKIVIDVRNNGGGTLDSAVELLNLFVTEGPVVYVDYATGEEDVYTSDLNEQKYDIAVLINSGSASATEIFAGAVKYKAEGIIIGTQSYGKGIVQSLYHLKDGAGVKFTTAEYFSVNKTPVHKIGITPDIIVENPKIDFTEYPEFSKEKKSNLGDVNLDVLSAEMILKTLGYEIDEPDGVYDEKSFKQIEKFQKDNNIYPYGIIDITTQNTLYTALTEHAKSNMEDLQLKTAYEQLMNNGSAID